MIPAAAGPFKDIDPLARIAFGLIFDRWKLSRLTEEQRDMNGQEPRFKTEPMAIDMYEDTGRERVRGLVIEGRVTYCVYSQPDLARDIGCSERTARRCIETLRTAGLIEYDHGGYNGANRYWVKWRLYRYFHPLMPAGQDDRQ